MLQGMDGLLGYPERQSLQGMDPQLQFAARSTSAVAQADLSTDQVATGDGQQVRWDGHLPGMLRLKQAARKNLPVPKRRPVD